MTELLADSLASQDAPSDAELISRVRGGDLAAYGELFERHVEAARRLARQLLRGPDSDDLVSDAFTKVMTVLQNGGGPDVAFRAYLLTAVRRLHIDKIRAQSRLTMSDDMAQFDPGVPFQDTAVAGFESGAAAKAFASLPERWQLVLWHLEVEGQKPADIAPLLGMSPNSVSALAYRAREGLRQAFLTAHLADTADTSCRWTTEHLGGYVREGLSKRDAGKVKEHLDDCRACTAMYLELTEVNSNLRAVIGPLLLGAAATGYFAAAGGGVAATGGILLLFDRAKDVVLANLTTVAAGSAAAAVSAVAVVAVATGVVGPGDTPRADAPPSADTPAAAPQDPGARERRAKKERERRAPRDVVQAASARDLVLTSAVVSDDALVLDVGGLPARPAVVTVALTSESGLTTFAPRTGACTVTASEPTRARCTTTGGSGGNSLLDLAPSSFQAVLPLAFPAELVGDRLTLDVGLEGADDPAGTGPSVSIDFTPTREPADPTPAAAPEVDLALALEPAGSDAVRATVTGLPSERSEILLDLAGGLDFGPAPDGCSSPDPGRLRCDAPPGTYETTLPVRYDVANAPVDVRITVSPVGNTETSPGDNTATVSLGAAPSPEADLVVTARGDKSLLGTGRFRVAVAGVPGVPFRLSIATDDPAVGLEGIPGNGTRAIGGDTCAYVGDSTTLLECSTVDGTFEGVFDLDLRELKGGSSVDITIAAAAPGFQEATPEDNIAQLRMSHRAIVVLEVRLTLADLNLLLSLGLYLGSVALPIG